jgi:hypothetical protein
LELGFEEAHQELSRALRTASTNSSEVFGELGLASKRILGRDGKSYFPDYEKKIKDKSDTGCCRRCILPFDLFTNVISPLWLFDNTEKISLDNS